MIAPVPSKHQKSRTVKAGAGAAKKPADRRGGPLLTHYRMTVSYDGTLFKGWQRQPRVPTIQGAIEDALARFAGKRIPVHGAGRTDAGVHALGQTAGFRAALAMDEKQIHRALNAILPPDIRVMSLEKTDSRFHARKSAVSKVYKYTIVNAPQVSPFIRRYVLHVPQRLDLPAMRKAAARFVREDDFTAFSSNREYHPVRKVLRAGIRKSGDRIVFTIEADGFLRYMVRTIVGTLLEVGRGRIRQESIEDLFRAKARTLKSPTAPARGLCLVKVIYSPSESRMTKASSDGFV